MKFRFKCKMCDHIHVVDLSGAEYYLPTRCPSCGYQYTDNEALRRWLDQVKREADQQN